MIVFIYIVILFFFYAHATPELYTLSLHDALPISRVQVRIKAPVPTTRAKKRRQAALLFGCCADDPTFAAAVAEVERSEEHTSELQSPDHLVCRLLLEKKNKHDGKPLECHNYNE